MQECTDPSFKNYIETYKGGTATVQGYTTVTKEANAAIETTATTSKVASVGIGLLNAALNVGIILAVSLAVEGLIKVIDNSVNAVKNQEQALSDATQAYSDAKQKISDTNTQLDDTNKKISELQAKGHLTFVEQDQLNTLIQSRSELEKELETYKLVEAEKNKAKTNEAVKTLNTYGSQKRSALTGETESPFEFDETKHQFAPESTNISKMIQNYQQLSLLGAKATKEQSDQLSSLKTNLTDIASKYETAANDIVPYDDATKKAKDSALSIRDAILKVVDSEQYAKNETNNFNSVFNDSKFSSIKTELQSLAQQGKLTAQTFNDSQYSDFVAAMKNVGLTIPDIITQIEALNTAQNNSGNTDAVSSLSDLTTQYQALSEKLETLQSIQDSYNEVGYISSDMLAKLTANNNELMQYIDIVNGKLVLNTQSLQDNADKIKAQMTETVQATLATQIYGIMQDDLKTKTAQAGDATDTAKGQIADMDETMRNAAIGAQVLAGGYSAVKDAFNGIPGSNTDLSKDAQKKVQNAIATAKKEIDTINKISINSPSEDTKHRKSTTSAVKSAESAAKKAAEALKQQYEAELKVIEANKEMDKYKPDKYGVEGLQYYNALLALQKKWQNSQLDSDDKLELQKKVLSAHKDYEQDILDVSYKELDLRGKLGTVQENSRATLQKLLEIQKLLNTANMSLVNTQENQLELQEKIYDAKKTILEAEFTDLENQVNLGKIQEGTLGYLQKLQKIKQDIINSDLGTADKETELESINEKIYSATNSYNESQINAVDHLVNIGKIQENSLNYISKLNYLYKHLNLTLEERESLQEKIFSAEKSYISQLESDLSDESIEGSYGYRIKAVQDQIDVINNQADAESKELAVEKAKAAWEEAQNQKTVQIYQNGKGFVYTADQSNITEKKEALADAEREERIEKLTEQKNQIQQEADDMTSKLESALKKLDGTSDRTWDDIQDEISNVIENVNKVFKTHTSKTKSYYSELDDALNESTNNTQEDYKKQIDAVNNFVKQMSQLQPQILEINQSIADSNNLVATSYQNIAKALLRAAYEYSDLENNRERANERYNEYNENLAKERKNGNHFAVQKYASGTKYNKIAGLKNVDEIAPEMIIRQPQSGRYTQLEVGDAVVPDNLTQSMFALANNASALLTNLEMPKINVSIPTLSGNGSTSHSYHIDKISFPNATDKDEIKNAFVELPLYLKQKEYSNN